MRGLVTVILVGCSFEHGGLPGDGRTIDTPTGEPPMFQCPPDYAALPNAPSLYRVVGGPSNNPGPGRTNWVGAELDCRDDQANGTYRATHLAIADTETEHTAFEDVIGAAAISGASKWLGVTDRKVEGTWVPITGVMPYFTDWGSPGLNIFTNCMLLDRTRIDTQHECENTSGTYDKGFICECDGRPVDPSTF